MVRRKCEFNNLIAINDYLRNPIKSNYRSTVFNFGHNFYSRYLIRIQFNVIIVGETTHVDS